MPSSPSGSGRSWPVREPGSGRLLPGAQILDLCPELRARARIAASNVRDHQSSMGGSGRIDGTSPWSRDEPLARRILAEPDGDLSRPWSVTAALESEREAKGTGGRKGLVAVS